MKLVIATANPHKAGEIGRMLSRWRVDAEPLPAGPQIPAPEETAPTLEENARLKAAYYYQHLKGPVLADDSGLFVDALGGLPGVRSSRYAGDQVCDADNNRKLLEALSSHLGRQARRARFICVAALCEADGQITLFRGQLDGWLSDRPRGSGGFGYDPLFVPWGYGVSLGEIPMALKNQISHRSRAMQQAAYFWAGLGHPISAGSSPGTIRPSQTAPR